jgi:endonuclease-8
MRIAIETAEFVAVAFAVPVAELIEASDVSRNTALRSLGPDLLDGEFDLEAAVTRLRVEGARAISEALLDQRIVAGIGNVYKSEVCFLCRVNPFTPVSQLADDQLRALLATARRLLQANVGAGASGGIVTRRTLRSMTGRAEEEGLWVYRRAGKPCHRCGATILWRRHGDHARSTYWCPACN